MNNQTDEATYNWIVGWLLAIGLFVMVIRTRSGYNIVYYCLFLLVVFLFVTQYQFIANAFAEITVPVTLLGGGASGTFSNTQTTSATTPALPTVSIGQFGPGGIITTV